MKTIVLTALAAGFLYTAPMYADPVLLTESQMDEVIAGVGAFNRGDEAWRALGNPPQNFGLAHHHTADNGQPFSYEEGTGVAVPDVVRGSECFFNC